MIPYNAEVGQTACKIISVKNMPKQLDGHLANLLASLSRLAVPAMEQINYLKSIALDDCADELALEFDDSFHLAGVLREHGLLTPFQEKAIRLVDDQLMRMSGPAKMALWNFDSLVNSSEWEKVRNLAAVALSAFPDRGLERK
jgi:hypothetical protein